MTSEPNRTDEPEEPPIRFTDKRKVDREAPAADAAEAAPAAGDAASDEAAGQADDRPTVALEDLQRLSAEYANYRRRADRERQAAGEVAVAKLLTDLLPVVDDIDRAREHGDLTGALKAVADKLDGVLSRSGLAAFGEVGDPFDPSRHEAVLHDESDAVSVPTCTTVMRKGYALGERLLRPAMVGVSDPVAGAGPEVAEATEDATAGQERHVAGDEPATDPQAEPAQGAQEGDPQPTGDGQSR